jgi:hypothetical protein
MTTHEIVFQNVEELVHSRLFREGHVQIAR